MCIRDRVLARHGLEIKEHGNGLVLVANNGTAVKASSVDRSLSKENLTQRPVSYTHLTLPTSDLV